MEKVLVTGASGRVGANVAKRLVAEGVAVRAMVMPEDPLARRLEQIPQVEIVKAALTDFDAIRRAVFGVSDIVHLAAQLVRGSTPVDKFYDINALGTLRLLEAAAEAGGVRRFLLASTDGTYRPGCPPEVPLTESSPQEPEEAYGTSKLLGELILRNVGAQHSIPWAIVRFATVLSPEESTQLFRYGATRSVLDRAKLGTDTNIWHLFENQPDMSTLLAEQVPDKGNPAVSVSGPSGTPWSLHVGDVRDIVDGVLLALRHPAALGEVFNIAGPASTRYDEGARVISAAFGVPIYNVTMPTDWRLEVDISKAQRLLGFSPQWTFEKMVNSVVEGQADAEVISAGKPHF
ncbi:NAD-dependent epimerase/dehydratase family protein [Novosphingobium mathurense]|uniref:UDP-glucose 4-epimerase n=1 Tax=Novosphingobium mathurense TaxID=428990 RepID=A0A1U6IL84_9SPHN|nr:NAD(P)-dependent oxidoreductase [Novosphingobium mathurense]SLK08773.1 UDP-glucose 4-epimerase [Novosphingobium mathurense]